jgi:hypothetical protein
MVTSQCTPIVDSAPTKLEKPSALGAGTADEPASDVEAGLERVKVEAKVAGAVEKVVADVVTSATPADVHFGQTAFVPASEEIPASSGEPTKKKKKNKGYKNMMASMMSSSPGRNVDKEKDDAIRKVTGGGAFTKIDKI